MLLDTVHHFRWWITFFCRLYIYIAHIKGDIGFLKDANRPVYNIICVRPKHIKSSKERCLLGQKHNLQIVGAIPFVKLQNDT